MTREEVESIIEVFSDKKEEQFLKKYVLCLCFWGILTTEIKKEKGDHAMCCSSHCKITIYVNTMA